MHFWMLTLNTLPFEVPLLIMLKKIDSCVSTGLVHLAQYSSLRPLHHPLLLKSRGFPLTPTLF